MSYDGDLPEEEGRTLSLSRVRIKQPAQSRLPDMASR